MLPAGGDRDTMTDPLMELQKALALREWEWERAASIRLGRVRC